MNQFFSLWSPEPLTPELGNPSNLGRSALETSEDEVRVDTVPDSEFHETEDGKFLDLEDIHGHSPTAAAYPGPIDRQDHALPFPGPVNSVADGGKEYLEGTILPVEHRGESLQDIYIRERLPEVQRVIASGDQDAIARLIAENEDDPFTILPKKLKYHELLAADLYFSFLTKMVTWFVMISLILPVLG